MPFAPSILKERESDYIKNPKQMPAPFMAVTFDSTPLGRQKMRAAMHAYDFTLRPQLVEETINPSYHRLIKAFERRTGIAGVLNTSYNLHGKPVVLGPKEALEAFQASGLQYLALGHVLIAKKQGISGGFQSTQQKPEVSATGALIQ